jgi:membrane dipeptidase
MRRGEVGICVATVIARTARPGNPLSGYSSPEIAYAVAQGQRHYYQALAQQGCIRLISDRLAPIGPSASAA